MKSYKSEHKIKEYKSKMKFKITMDGVIYLPTQAKPFMNSNHEPQ